MKLLNSAVVLTGLCDLALAVPVVPESAVSSQKPRQSCVKRPHSLATSHPRSYHSFSETWSKIVTIPTSITKSTITTGAHTTGAHITGAHTTCAPITITITASPTTCTPVTITITATGTSTTTATDTTTTSATDTTTTTTSGTTTTTATDTTTTTATGTSTTTTTTTATTTTGTASATTCDLGTGFGYRPPVNNVVQSFELDDSGGNNCNRWGWYTTPTLAQLQAVGGVSGQILVGAGNNNLNAATNVGTYTATAVGNIVTVTYSLTAQYGLYEVHVDLECLPIATCAPGQYTFVAENLANVPTYSNPPGTLVYPTCGQGGQAYLIVHAAVRGLTTGACDDD